MRILLYEFITGGGMYSITPTQVPSGSLLREGAAMIQALASDFAKLPGTNVVAFRDQRLTGLDLPNGVDVVGIRSAEQELQQLAAAAKDSDWTIVIAPEFNELLFHRVRHVERAGGRLLSPSSITVSMMHNKHITLAQLAHRGIATPRGGKFRSGFPLPRKLVYPVIIKPLHGAGSTAMRLVESPDHKVDLLAGERYRIEEYCPGVPVSVAVLCGPNGHSILPPTRQSISDDGTFRYLGGKLPLRCDLADRATNLASYVTQAMILSTGYIGIDMVLAEGKHDCAVVIELNPRLTTSYVGLRKLARCNLAQAMIDAAEGRTPDLLFDEEPVEFLADGTIIGK